MTSKRSRNNRSDESGSSEKSLKRPRRFTNLLQNPTPPRTRSPSPPVADSLQPHRERQPESPASDEGVSHRYKQKSHSDMPPVPGSSSHPFRCRECNAVFITRAKYGEHANDYHNHRERYYCDYCDRSFATREVLRTHCRQQHKNKRDQ